MSHFLLSRLMVVFSLVASVSACDDEPAATTSVAKENAKIPMSAMTAKAIEGIEFSFTQPVPMLSPTPFKLKFTMTAATAPAFDMTVGATKAAGMTRFGSCIFNITSSNIPGVTVGQMITVNPCQVVVSTGGVQATGNATTVQILLQLGIVPSAANQASVSIDPKTGVVTVNNVNTGVSVQLGVVTGSVGS